MDENDPILNLEELQEVLESVIAVTLVTKESIRKPSRLEKLAEAVPIMAQLLGLPLQNKDPLRFQDDLYEGVVKSLVEKYSLLKGYSGFGISTIYLESPPKTSYSVYFSNERYARKFIFCLNGDTSVPFTGILKRTDVIGELVMVRELSDNHL